METLQTGRNIEMNATHDQLRISGIERPGMNMRAGV